MSTFEAVLLMFDVVTVIVGFISETRLLVAFHSDRESTGPDCLLSIIFSSSCGDRINQSRQARTKPNQELMHSYHTMRCISIEEANWIGLNWIESKHRVSFSSWRIMHRNGRPPRVLLQRCYTVACGLVDASAEINWLPSCCCWSSPPSAYDAADVAVDAANDFSSFRGRRGSACVWESRRDSSKWSIDR